MFAAASAAPAARTVDAAGGDGDDGLGAGEAEHEVVRLAAAAVGMAFDDEPCIRVMAEPVAQAGQFALECAPAERMALLAMWTKAAEGWAALAAAARTERQ